MLGGCRGLFSLYQLAGVLFAKPYLSAVGAGGEGEKESLRAAAKPGDVCPGGCVSVWPLGWVPVVSDASVSCSPSPGGLLVSPRAATWCPRAVTTRFLPPSSAQAAGRAAESGCQTGWPQCRGSVCFGLESQFKKRRAFPQSGCTPRQISLLPLMQVTFSSPDPYFFCGFAAPCLDSVHPQHPLHSAPAGFQVSAGGGRS